MRLAALLVFVSACGRCTNGAGNPASDASVEAALAAAARPPEVDELWARAREGEADDLARLANREGASGLVERGAGPASDPAQRKTALLALAYAGGFEGLPWLAENVGGNDLELALVAAGSVVEIAARRRAQVDPEDALELREGCDALLVVAKDAQRPRKLRVAVVRALRMLSDYGCAKASELPADVDAVGAPR